jgi:hypothetical protein
MKRLSLEELKAQRGNAIGELEAIKGGNADECHDGPIYDGGTLPEVIIIGKKKS